MFKAKQPRPLVRTSANALSVMKAQELKKNLASAPVSAKPEQSTTVEPKDMSSNNQQQTVKLAYSPSVDYTNEENLNMLSMNGLRQLLQNKGVNSAPLTEGVERSSEMRAILLEASRKALAGKSYAAEEEAEEEAEEVEENAFDFDAEEQRDVMQPEPEEATSFSVSEEQTQRGAMFVQVGDADFQAGDDEIVEITNSVESQDPLNALAATGDSDAFYAHVDSMDRAALISHVEDFIESSEHDESVYDMATDKIRDVVIDVYVDALEDAEAALNDMRDDAEAEDEDFEDSDAEDFEDSDDSEYSDGDFPLANQPAYEVDEDEEGHDDMVMRRLETTEYIDENADYEHLELTTRARLVLVVTSRNDVTNQTETSDLQNIVIGESEFCAHHPLRRVAKEGRNQGWFVAPLENLATQIAMFNAKERVYCGPLSYVTNTVYAISDNLNEVANAVIYLGDSSEDTVQLPDGLTLSDLAKVNVQPSIQREGNVIDYNFIVNLVVPILSTNSNSEKLRANLEVLNKLAKKIIDDATEGTVDVVINFSADLATLMESTPIRTLVQSAGYFDREDLTEQVNSRIFVDDEETEEGDDPENFEEVVDEDADAIEEPDMLTSLVLDFDSIDYLLPWNGVASISV